MPNQEDFSMPGPHFGNESPAGSWLKKNWRSLAAMLILALLATGAAYFYNSYRSRVALLAPALKDITASPGPAISSPVTGASNNAVKGATTPEANRDGADIIVTAAKGNGATHLARQALKEYLKDKPELAQKLSAEQRIYIEDYLRKHLTDQPKTLHPGDRLTFSNNDIQNAIDLALNLTDSQIKNLSRYAPLVPSLMTP